MHSPTAQPNVVATLLPTEGVDPAVWRFTATMGRWEEHKQRLPLPVGRLCLVGNADSHMLVSVVAGGLAPVMSDQLAQGGAMLVFPSDPTPYLSEMLALKL